MPTMKFKDINFREDSIVVILKANEIIEDYQGQGFDLTLRQLYYQFVARGLIENTQRSYKRLGSIINDGRLAGLIDWLAITDRTRELRSHPHWDHPRDLLKSCAGWYARDKWEGQAYRVEVWVEKDALIDVVERACDPLDVPYFSCRGYVSQSEMWQAAERLIAHEAKGADTVIIHLGDHDPSGLDMSRDIRDRLYMFHSQVEVDRIALTMEQVEELNPPPNPAKITDSRSDQYIADYGDQSWELDALDPQFMVDLITKSIGENLDTGKWMKVQRKEKRERNKIKKLAKEWK